MKRWIAIGVVVAVVVVGGVLMASEVGKGSIRAQAPGQPTPAAQESSSITASGALVPLRQSKLAFKTSGLVKKVHAREGDVVEAGATLVDLDTAELDLQVQAAKDDVGLQEAMLEQTRAAQSEEQVAAAQAAVDAAQARLEELKKGVSADAVASVEARVKGAEAKLAALKARPGAEQVAAAKATLDKAQANLRLAQAAYDKISWMGNVAASPQASNLEIATADYNAAKARYEEASRGATEEELEAAQSELEAARASRDAALAGPAADAIKAAESNLAAAQAQLVRAKAGDTDIAVAEARLQRAKTTLAQAERARQNAFLSAPYAGKVAELRIEEGDTIAAGSPAVIFGDDSQLLVETNDLDETSAASIRTGQAVQVSVNALEGKVLPGKVVRIAPIATVTPSGDANYTVTIALEKQDPELRWGMTVKVDFGSR